MIELPFTPTTPGEAMLATYLRGKPGRLPVLQSIIDRLDPDGAVGDRARYYIVRSNFRRAVLRGALIALGFTLPSWSKETAAAAEANARFVADYRQRPHAR
ncbi:hypothetical protein [Sphingomonas sp. UNC305MFCol5.2]|uniref:hypothetical protein n=1 Tax=Sphingomonas sp. UNC305MFCol5.2 TaxID=1449076 RepID=UPI0004A295FB|nr:hypothetical protein [Sphingomonas sp. UNC305MFCol5.2]